MKCVNVCMRLCVNVIRHLGKSDTHFLFSNISDKFVFAMISIWKFNKKIMSILNQYCSELVSFDCYFELICFGISWHLGRKYFDVFFCEKIFSCQIKNLYPYKINQKLILIVYHVFQLIFTYLQLLHWRLLYTVLSFVYRKFVISFFPSSLSLWV